MIEVFLCPCILSFPFVYGVGDNSKEDNAKRKTEVCYVREVFKRVKWNEVSKELVNSCISSLARIHLVTNLFEKAKVIGCEHGRGRRLAWSPTQFSVPNGDIYALLLVS